MTLSQLKQRHPNYFARGNKDFFGDASYKMLHSKQTKTPYLVTYTAMWSDMFGSPKRYVYRIKPIDPHTFAIGNLVDTHFQDLDEVKDYLRGV